jgi:gas vesicle protein
VRDRGENKMSKITGFLAGMMSGALVGTVTALLLAPMSGRELQVRAREEIDNLVDDAKTAAETKRVQLEAQLEAMKAPKTPETEIA